MVAALAASLLGPLGAVAPVAASHARPAAAPARAAAAPGPVTGTPCSPACDLYATTGTLTLPDAATVPIWGYSLSGTPGSATLPGPLLDVTAGTSVAITLHNVDLPTATALMIAGQPGVPDTTGVTAGNSRTYSFPATGAGALLPGTYLYEAGLTFDGPRQVAMGLHGALIVRPAGAPLQAYADANSTFTDEAALVLSEIDPAFNAAPATFDMTTFAPKYWLINGKGYPNTDTIGTAAGSTVLLRYVNAGLQTHSMSLLGLHQTIIATDGQPATNQSRVVAQTVPPGGTLDTLVSVPAAAPTGTQYAVFEAAMHMDNKGAATGGVINFGGMLTFLAVSSGTTSGGSGPVTSAVNLTPNPSDGSTAVTLSATISGTPDQAEYFVDALGADGAGCAISGPLTTVSVSIPVSGATAPCVDLTALSGGSHTFYVHGHDATDGWGAVASAVLNLDTGGPAISNMGLTPSADNGTVDVALQATASDVATGNQNVTAAEYSIDGGAATPIPVPLPATVVSLSATISAASALALAEGNHTVAVRAQDALGNWGAPGTTTLKVDKSGPGSSAVTAVPNPNNGTLGVQIGTGGAFYVRIDATVADALSGGVNSNIAAAEYFFDTVGANGTGGAMIPTDGSYNSPSEAAYAAVDMIHIASLTAGTHTIYVHGRDAAGNWGATSSISFLIDRIAPTFTSISLAPNPTLGAASVTLTVNGAVDTGGAGVGGGEYWINPPTTTTPAAGSGTQFSGLTASIPVGSLATGTYTVSARIRDAAGNWSTGTGGIRTATLTVLPDTIFSNGFDTGFAPWGWTSRSTNTTARLNATAAAALVGARGLQAQGNNTNYVQLNFGTAAQPVTGTFDARFSFNPHGNTGTNQDIFVARTTGGTTVFRVRYRWNGGSPQVQVQVGTGTGNALWTPITNNASNRIEAVWQSGSTLQLLVGGSLVANQSLTATATSVGQFRLGSVTSGGSATLEYFDALSAKRTVTPYGP